MPQQDRSKMDKTKGDSKQPPQAGEKIPANVKRDARRRILTGGLVGAPVIMTLASRPALANHCSISGMQSGNISKVHNVDCRGFTPGGWKTENGDGDASQYIEVGPCNPLTQDNSGQCSDYSVPTEEELNDELDNLNQGTAEYDAINDYLNMLLNEFPNSPPFGTPFAAIFGSGLTSDPNLTMMQALWANPILAHAAAAWLNAREFGKEAYGMSPQEVVDFVAANIQSNGPAMKDALEILNERG